MTELESDPIRNRTCHQLCYPFRLQQGGPPPLRHSSWMTHRPPNAINSRAFPSFDPRPRFTHSNMNPPRKNSAFLAKVGRKMIFRVIPHALARWMMRSIVSKADWNLRLACGKRDPSRWRISVKSPASSAKVQLSFDEENSMEDEWASLVAQGKEGREDLDVATHQEYRSVVDHLGAV